MFDFAWLPLDQLPRLSEQLKAWQKLHPKLGCFVMLAEADRDHLPVIQTAFQQTGVALTGAIFPQLIHDCQFVSGGILIQRFPVMPPHFLQGALNIDNEHAALQVLGRLLPIMDQLDAPAPHKLFLVFDGMLPNISSILTRLWRTLHERASYHGINAGSETFQPMPCLFDETQCLSDGVLVLLMPSETVAVARNAYIQSKLLLNATSTAGNRIAEIDGRPAFEVYCEVIQSEYNIQLTRDNFYQYAVHYPLGLISVLDVLIRIPVAVGEDGSVYCVGEIPDHSRLRIIKAPLLEESTCVAQLAEQLQLPSSVAQPLLVFYCAGRRMHFADQSQLELQALTCATQATVMAGALTLGEIDTVPDMSFPEFHNASIVCLR